MRAEFEMLRGRPVCVSVNFDAGACRDGVRTADLAQLPGLDRMGLEAFQKFGTPILDDADWEAGRNLHRTAEIFRTDARANREALKRRPDEELAQIAQVYRAHIDRDPAGAVAEALGVSRATAARRIKEARDGDFLPKTTQGKKRG